MDFNICLLIGLLYVRGGFEIAFWLLLWNLKPLKKDQFIDLKTSGSFFKGEIRPDNYILDKYFWSQIIFSDYMRIKISKFHILMTNT